MSHENPTGLYGLISDQSILHDSASHENKCKQHGTQAGMTKKLQAPTSVKKSRLKLESIYRENPHIVLKCQVLIII